MSICLLRDFESKQDDALGKQHVSVERTCRAFHFAREFGTAPYLGVHNDAQSDRDLRSESDSRAQGGRNELAVIYGTMHEHSHIIDDLEGIRLA